MSPINFQRLGVALILAALGGGWLGTVSVWALLCTGITGLALLWVTTELIDYRSHEKKERGS